MHLRGGGPKAARPPRYIYSHYGGRAQIPDRLIGGHPVVDPAVFRAAALRLLGITDDVDWLYTVDQYRNQEEQKPDLEKALVRSFQVTKANFTTIYANFLKARVSNTLQDWIMVVRWGHYPSLTPPSYTLPIVNNEGNPPPFDAVEPVASDDGQPPDDEVVPPPDPDDERPPSTRSPSPAPPPTGPRRAVFRVDRNESQDFVDTWQSFHEAIRRVLAVAPNADDPLYQVNFYSNQLGVDNRYHHFVIWAASAGQRTYNEKIGPLAFRTTGDWKLTVQVRPNGQIPLPPAEPLWPPWDQVAYTLPNPSAPTVFPLTKGVARIWGPTNARSYRLLRDEPTTTLLQRFLKIVRKYLPQLPATGYRFRVDFHSRQLPVAGAIRNRFLYHHHRIVDEANQDLVLSSISKYLFERDDQWFIRIVDVSNAQQLSAPIDLTTGPGGPPSQDVSTAGSVPSNPSTATSYHTVPSSASTQGPKDGGYIFAWSGKLTVKYDDENSFVNGALKLLNIDPETEWWFRVAVYGPNNAPDPTELVLLKKDYSDHYPQIARAVDVDGDFRVFVYRGSVFPRTAEDLWPSPYDALDVVCIEVKDPSHVEAYWRVPANVKDIIYGLNQYQDDFYRAMGVHYNSHLPRAAAYLGLDRFELGWGAKEFPGKHLIGQLHDDMDIASRTLRNRPPPDPNSSLPELRLKYRLAPIPERTKAPDGTVGVRMIGNTDWAHNVFDTADASLTDLASTIEDMSYANGEGAVRVPDKPIGRGDAIPHNYRIWRTADQREAGLVDSMVIPYVRDLSKAGLANLWRAGDQAGELLTSCLWFRPEWTRFTLIDQTTTPFSRVQWDVTPTTSRLEDFRRALERLFKLVDNQITDAELKLKTDNFTIWHPDWWPAVPMGTLHITGTTLEDHWRKHVFDWFQGNEIYVRSRTDGIEFCAKLHPLSVLLLTVYSCCCISSMGFG